VELILAIELLCAAQGLDYRKPLRLAADSTGPRCDSCIVPRLEADRPPANDINHLVLAIHEGKFGEPIGL